MAIDAGQTAGTPPSRSVLLALLFAAAVIGYIDRGSMSIAIPVISHEIPITPPQKGWLLGSFFVIYAFFQIYAGWLIDRFGVFWVFVIGFGTWALATLSTGFAHSLSVLVTLRLLLGLGESVMFPGFANIVAGHFAPSERGLPNALLDAGTKIGPALGVLLGGLLLANYNWRAMFFILGTCSLIWLIPWILWGVRGKTRRVETGTDHTVHPQSPELIPSFKEILACRDAWGTFLGAGCYTYAYFFLLTWLPSYLVDVRHLRMKELGLLGSAPYLASAIAAVATGYGSDVLIKRGFSATVVRKSVVAIGLLLSIAALPAALVPTVRQSLGLLIVAYIAFGVFASNLWTISQTLSGAVAAAKWAGLQNCLGALTGIAAPVATGYIIQSTGSYQLAFVLTAVLAAVGATSYLFIVGPIAPIDWAARRRQE